MRVTADHAKWVIWIAGLAVAADMKIKIDSIELKVTRDPCLCLDQTNPTSDRYDLDGEKRSDLYGSGRLANLVSQPGRSEGAAQSPGPYLKRSGYSGGTRTQVDRKSPSGHSNYQGSSHSSCQATGNGEGHQGSVDNSRRHREGVVSFAQHSFRLGGHKRLSEGGWIGNEDPFNAGQGRREEAWASQGEAETYQAESRCEASASTGEKGRSFFGDHQRREEGFKGQEEKTERNRNFLRLGGIKLPLSLREEDILRFLRFSVTESAAATFTENEYQTNLSLERGMIAAIHTLEIEILPSTLEVPAASSSETVSVQITREGKTALVNFNDSDALIKVVVQVARGAAIGTDAGPVVTLLVNPHRFMYRPPILFAGESLFVGVQATNAAAQTIRGRIGYSLISVPEKMYFRVANSLLQ